MSAAGSENRLPRRGVGSAGTTTASAGREGPALSRRGPWGSLKGGALADFDVEWNDLPRA
jgi:hypothetical protein